MKIAALEERGVVAIGEVAEFGGQIDETVRDDMDHQAGTLQHAAHRNFGKLLEEGVKIYEFPTTLLHQKVMTVDGVWSAVGSTNFDDRSFEINDEITLGIHGKSFAKQLEDLFEEDQKVCKQVDAKQWNQRDAMHKLKDHFYYLWNEML